MIETYWDDRTGELYYYNFETGIAQWERPNGYQIPHQRLANQPWSGNRNREGRPFWVNETNGTIMWSMPEVFREAMHLGARARQDIRNPLYHYKHPPALKVPVYEETEDDEAEDKLLEYVLRLSLRGDGNIQGQAKGKGKAKQPADKRKRQLRGREKNILTNKIPPVDMPLVLKDAVGRCNACFDKATVSQAPCGCRYCPNCLVAIFMQASEDESPPPRCCGRILPIDLAAPILEQIGIHAATSETVPTNGKARIIENKARTKEKYKSETEDVAAEGSKSNAQTISLVDCLVCMSSFNAKDVIKTPCQHYYCRDCMKRHFLEATKNESLYPPKCCGRDIPITIANTVLNAQQQTEFANKGMEFRTKDRLYCSSRYCSAFIHPTQVNNNVGMCGQCRQRTCSFCKGAYHRGDCPKDKDIQEVLKLAQSVGWRRCFSCKTMIELDQGCNHITCGCGAEFCYICGAVWRTCDCELWQQENIEDLQGDMPGPAENPYIVPIYPEDPLLPFAQMGPAYMGPAHHDQWRY